MVLIKTVKIIIIRYGMVLKMKNIRPWNEIKFTLRLFILSLYSTFLPATSNLFPSRRLEETDISKSGVSYIYLKSKFNFFPPPFSPEWYFYPHPQNDIFTPKVQWKFHFYPVFLIYPLFFFHQTSISLLIGQEL